MFKKIAVIATTMLASASAMATTGTTGVDITQATATLSAVEGNLVTIGGIMIGLAAVAVGIKWVKGMIFG